VPGQCQDRRQVAGDLDLKPPVPVRFGGPGVPGCGNIAPNRFPSSRNVRHDLPLLVCVIVGAENAD
jgi:hypothetical protein